MRVMVFDVEHGACAFVKSPSGCTLLIDCGKAADFDPVDYILNYELNGTVEWKKGYPLTQLIVTHPHDDHIENIDAVVSRFKPAILDRQRYDWEGIKRPDAQDAEYQNLDTYSAWQETYSSPVVQAPNWGMSIQRFCLTPNEARRLSEPSYVNNSGIVSVVTVAGTRFSEKFLFGADVEQDGWKALLMREDFRSAVNGTDFYVVPHHGHTSGFSTELYDAMGGKPILNLISVTSRDEHVDQRYMSSDYASGTEVNGEKRYALTTRSDGTIIVDVNGEGRFSVAGVELPPNIRPGRSVW
jgi:beta-lactamase superfamily II metal-dependent hydrolase